MTMSKRSFSGTLILIVAWSSFLLAQQPKKTVAVMDFDFGSVQKWWEGPWDIGKGIADLVVDELLKDGTYRLVERKTLEEIRKEQTLAEDQRGDATAAAKVGKLLGVNAMLMGSVTQFGTEKKGFSIPVIGGRFPGFGLGGIGKEKGKAKVSVTARIVDATTGEILGSVTGMGESQRSGLLLGGVGVGFGSGTVAGGGISMTSSDFRQTILGEATVAAVADLVKKLTAAGDKIPYFEPEVRGVIAYVENGTVILNLGNALVKPGDVLQVLTVKQQIKDPATGLVIHEITEEVGQVRIDTVEEKSSVGTIVQGSGVKIGDAVKN